MSSTQAVVYKRTNNRVEHAEEYIVFVDDPKEVGHSTLPSLLRPLFESSG